MVCNQWMLQSWWDGLLLGILSITANLYKFCNFSHVDWVRRPRPNPLTPPFFLQVCAQLQPNISVHDFDQLFFLLLIIMVWIWLHYTQQSPSKSICMNSYQNLQTFCIKFWLLLTPYPCFIKIHCYSCLELVQQLTGFCKFICMTFGPKKSTRLIIPTIQIPIETTVSLHSQQGTLIKCLVGGHSHL